MKIYEPMFTSIRAQRVCSPVLETVLVRVFRGNRIGRLHRHTFMWRGEGMGEDEGEI